MTSMLLPRFDHPPRLAAPSRPLVEARLLGTFEIRVDGVPVGSWRGRRGASVLRYLLARPGHRCTRDELLEEFWPGVPVAMGSNRLQVAVSAVRRALAGHTPVNVVEYADGGYRVSDAIHLEVDSELLESLLDAARIRARRGDVDSALAAYVDALDRYAGDFAADVPYEQWTFLPRESLRIRYLDALDEVSRLLLDRGDLEGCISTALRMIAADPCREDAHRLLMRCYAAQGRPYQALRQYEFCRRVLATTIDAAPSPATNSLYDAIRAGEHVCPP